MPTPEIGLLCAAAIAAMAIASGGGPVQPRVTIVAMGDSTTAGTPAFLSPVEKPPHGAGDETEGNEAENAGSNAAIKVRRGPSKIDQVIALLRRQEGATLAEMVEATGWLPHTTRAALTGLKKKGHTIEKSKRDDVTCYRIVEAG